MANKPLNIEIERHLSWGPLQLICTDENDDPVDLTDWVAYCEARKNKDTDVVLDFLPELTLTPTDGIIVFPGLEPADTADLPEGDYGLQLILENGAGTRWDPDIKGVLKITTGITQPAAT